MIKKFSLILAFVFSTGIIFTACDPEHSSTDQSTETEDVQNERDGEDSNPLLEGFPSALQAASSLLKAKTAFNSSLVNEASNAENYTNSFSQGLNLGAYQADLGYVIIHEQNQDAIAYFQSVQSLGDQLGIFSGSASELIERAQNSLDDQEALFRIISESFLEADIYLHENKQPQTAALIVTGGWLEGTYIATQLNATESDAFLTKRIAEEKPMVKRLASMIDTYANGPEMKTLAKELTALSVLYNDISISHTFVEPTTDEGNRVTTINSTKSVEVSQEQLASITEKVSEIRNKYIQ